MLALPSATCHTALAQSDAAAAAHLEARARQEFEAGREAYEEGNFREALTHYERAYALSARPKLLFNIARAADADGSYERAIEAYELYLERMQDAENRAFAEARLDKLRGQTRSGAPPSAPPAPAMNVDGSLGSPGTEAAPTRPGRLRFHAGPYLGFGGKMHQERGELSDPSNLKPSYGAQLGAEYLALRYLGVGVELRLSTLLAKGDPSDRDLLTDLLVKPTGRYPLLDGALELHASLPVGLTIPALSTAASEGYGWSESTGGALGISTGATYFFGSKVGLKGELGFGWHWYKARYEGDDSEVSFRTKQAFLAVSVVFATGAPR